MWRDSITNPLSARVRLGVSGGADRERGATADRVATGQGTALRGAVAQGRLSGSPRWEKRDATTLCTWHSSKTEYTSREINASESVDAILNPCT